MIRAALTLASRGMHVFPCVPRDKRPATEHGVKDATADAEIIRRWWQHDPQFNVAIATGEVSNVFVVDIDGVDAELELRRLEAAHGELPATVESITARGRHLFFQMPETPVRKHRPATLPPASIRAATVVMSSARHRFTRAAAPMRGRSIAPARSQPRPIGCSRASRDQAPRATAIWRRSPPSGAR